MKKDIISRLFKEGHITIDEVLVLMEEKEKLIYVPAQPQNPFPNYPLQPYIGGPNPFIQKFDVTCDKTGNEVVNF